MVVPDTFVTIMILLSFFLKRESIDTDCWSLLSIQNSRLICVLDEEELDICEKFATLCEKIHLDCSNATMENNRFTFEKLNSLSEYILRIYLKGRRPQTQKFTLRKIVKITTPEIENATYKLDEAIIHIRYQHEFVDNPEFEVEFWGHHTTVKQKVTVKYKQLSIGGEKLRDSEIYSVHVRAKPVGYFDGRWTEWSKVKTFRVNNVAKKGENLEKAYARVPREELWYCMRKSGVAEKYVRAVQDMYERSRTAVRCAVGQTEEFKVEVGLHQGSALSPFLFAMVMDQLSEEVRQESPWTMMFADDIVICSESREQVEENLERWRFALERRGMEVSRSKTEYMCVTEREGSGTVRLQGEEVKKVQEFKYLGSTVQSNGDCGKEVNKRVQADAPSVLYILLCPVPIVLIVIVFLIHRWKKEIQTCIFPDVPGPKDTLAQIHRQKLHLPVSFSPEIFKDFNIYPVVYTEEKQFTPEFGDDLDDTTESCDEDVALKSSRTTSVCEKQVDDDQSLDSETSQLKLSDEHASAEDVHNNPGCRNVAALQRRSKDETYVTMSSLYKTQ
ncbi:hypothetical protein QTP86_014885 [Hemibagrus guttatus]|nr:hypothetical protein QTP86_014885 [Hemibagrus guttatus]